MSLTAVVTNHNYARFLRKCIDTATRWCDEVLVYDDGSTDESMSVLSEYGVTVTRREEPSGGPVWGSNLGIEEATCSHLIFLDADNFLVRQPPTDDIDYTYADILLADEGGAFTGLWRYPDWPLTGLVGIERFKVTHQMPYPWGGVWRHDFIRDLRWREWPSTQMAADFRTAVDWAFHDPKLAYTSEPFLAFRMHGAQWSASPEREKMQADATAAALLLE